MTPKQAIAEALQLIRFKDIDRFVMPVAGPGRAVDVVYVVARQLIREAKQ